MEELLRGIAELKFRKVPTPEIQVIVADNDASGTAAAVCDSIHMQWPLKYVIEPRRGISQARNRAISEVGESDFIAFIDDDEVPEPAWLDELLWAQTRFGADAVTGPVLPSFTADVPKWIRKGRFFDRPLHASGDFLDCCSTNNALIARTVLDCVPAFDERFGLTGGEDVHFFLRIRRAGFKIAWSADAVVSEAISSKRANLGWLLLRAYRGGNCFTLVESTLDKRASTRIFRVVKACGRLTLGSLRVPVSLFQGKAAATQALQSICLGAGMITALAGWQYQEYKSAGVESKEQVIANTI